MNRKQSFFVDPIKGGISLITLVFLVAIAVCLITMAEYLPAAIFGAAGLLFLPQVWQYDSRVCFDERGVRCSFCGYTRLFLSWEDIAEVGVAGNRVFGSKKKPGTLYLYLSPAVMTEDERFQMMLRFPPKGKIVLAFTDRNYAVLRQYWEGAVCSYNAGDRTFF